MEPKTYTVTIRIGEQRYIVGHYLAHKPKHALDAATEDLKALLSLSVTTSDNDIVAGLPHLVDVARGVGPEDLEPIYF